MRYFQKLLCLLILVLAASFGVGGCVLLYSDFSVQRSRMAAANAAAHAQACTLLQTEILDLQRRGISTGDAALTARVTAQGVPAALWRGDTLVCATLEGLQSLPLGDAATVTVRTENSIYAVYASDLQGGLRFVTAYDLTGLYRDRNAALMRFLLLEAAVLAAASAVTALLARRLTRPLAVLTDAGAQIAAGDYARRTDLHTGDEIEEIARQVNKMVRSIQELSQRNIALAEVNNRMEMQNLQAQINPHFIYNTLDNIRYLIPTDPQRAQQLIGRFIGILRYSINNTKHNVPVKDDLKYLQDYLVIQSTRFGANFSYEIDIDDACMEFIIPKLLLQPLLENSIKYGFQKKPRIHIRVRGWLGEDALYFTVEDNGGGVDETMLEQLRDILRSDEVNIEHNGLQNINRRIWLGYGGDSGLTIDSTEGEGFTVKLKLRLGGM